MVTKDQFALCKLHLRVLKDKGLIELPRIEANAAFLFSKLAHLFLEELVHCSEEFWVVIHRGVTLGERLVEVDHGVVLGDRVDLALRLLHKVADDEAEEFFRAHLSVHNGPSNDH